MNKHILKLNSKEKGMSPLSFLLRRFNLGDKVVIKPYPKDKNQLPNYRFFGKIGKIVELNSPRSIKVEIEGKMKRSRSKKYIITSNLHLKLIQEEPKND